MSLATPASSALIVRASGAVIGVDRFGESAPASAVYRHFNLTADNVVASVKAVIAKERQ